nr:XTP/dITP diphosphatase [Staphylococcus equorum]
MVKYGNKSRKNRSIERGNIIVEDIVIASNNKGKINDFKVIFPDFNVISISEIIEDFDVEETGDTFEANAKLKSEAAAKALNKRVIADDSGLEVFALNGEPGVYSARYAGTAKDDDANIEKVLSKLGGSTNRSAQFVCVISMSAPNEETVQFKGTVQGEITLNKIGENGFGYDPIFYIDDKNITMAQLTVEEKSEISHRGRAIEKLQHYLEGDA